MVNYRTYLICRIIYTTLFLIISTTIWFNRRVVIYHDIESNFEVNEVVISNLKRLKDNDNRSYNIVINNKNEKKQNMKLYLVSDIMSESTPNNYIKYQVNEGSIKTLNMDGMIVVSELEGLESMNLNLKVWISDTYQGNLNYEGRVIVA